ncbi:MAG: LPS O-antigen length regulator [Gammaproteobacteria bacterium]|nr:MAG: LPS O-antigen length regulator [Gammaproteobacteria bacterium]
MNQNEQNTSIATDDEIDLIELFKVFWAHKLMIVIITAIFTAGSVAYALYLPNIYTAEVTLAPVSSDGNSLSGGLGALGGLASLAGISTSSGGDTAANIAVIKSRQFIMEFIKENNLLPILFADAWDAENKKWFVEDQKQIPTLQKGYAKFSNYVLSISENKKTGLMTLKTSWYDPELSAKWANTVVEKANLFLKQKAIAEANQSIAYLKDQINNTSEVGIQELLYKLIEKELQTTKLANVRKEYAFKVLDPALVPELKSKPKRLLICVFGSMLGCIFSCILVLVVTFRKRCS